MAFSMERFLAICHPLHLYTMSGLQRAVRIIAALWLLSFASAVPFAVFTKIHYLKYPKSEYEKKTLYVCTIPSTKAIPWWWIIIILLYNSLTHTHANTNNNVRIFLFFSSSWAFYNREIKANFMEWNFKLWCIFLF